MRLPLSLSSYWSELSYIIDVVPVTAEAFLSFIVRFSVLFSPIMHPTARPATAPGADRPYSELSSVPAVMLPDIVLPDALKRCSIPR